jgi:hypothetical protein
VDQKLIELGMATKVMRPDMAPDQEYLATIMPPRVIYDKVPGGRYQNNEVARRLSTSEYDHFCDLAAGVGLKNRDQTLHDNLKEMIQGNFENTIADPARWVGQPEKALNAQRDAISQRTLEYRHDALDQLKWGEQMGGEGTPVEKDLQNLKEKKRQSRNPSSSKGLSVQ